MPKHNIYSVGQINLYIKQMFAQDYMLGLVYVRGEISNLKYHSSGHIYFTLKDEQSAISCIMFAGNARSLKFRLKEGMGIVAKGKIEVYERDGKYQLYASEIKEEGQGDLNEQFEQLKQRLSEMGMFAEEYKQPIPYYIHKLGVVTSPTGAAVQDIINVALRRNPYLQIILYPAIVQGDQAAESVVTGIKVLEKYGVDTIIVGRGGGSMEDLWAFNEEIVAQAIFDCMVPIISAVGHETDFTIADFVSDLRAPTPSAAAELAVNDIQNIEKKIEYYQRRFDGAFHHHFQQSQALLKQYELRLKSLSVENQLKEKKESMLRYEQQLTNAMKELLDNRKHMLELYIARMKGASPLEKLSKGYGHIEDDVGNAIHSIIEVSTGDPLHIFVQDGKIFAKVEGVEKITLS